MSSGQKVPQDAKKEEFRKYLEKAGVLELLTKSLVQLYEVPVMFSGGLGSFYHFKSPGFHYSGTGNPSKHFCPAWPNSKFSLFPGYICFFL